MRPTAKQKFNKGDRVRASKKLLERRKMKYPDRLATVAGFGSDIHPEVLYVVPDGTKTWQDFHMDDWEKVEEPRIGIQSRVHEEDLTEHVLEKGEWSSIEMDVERKEPEDDKALECLSENAGRG
jgi:hypothetical protein